MRSPKLLPWIIALVVTGAGCAGKREADLTSLPAVEDIEKLLDDVVADPERRKQMLEVTAEMGRTAQIFFQEVAEVQIQLVRTGLDYDAPPGDLEAIMARIDTAREAGRDDLIELTLRGREILTPAEWTAFAARRIEHVESLEEDGRQ